MGFFDLTLVNSFIMAASTTWEILSDKAKYTTSISELGLDAIVWILDYVGVIGAVIVIVASLVMLLIVNYPKTVAQTKQRIAQSFISVIIIGLLPLIFDTIYTAILYGAQ